MIAVKQLLVLFLGDDGKTVNTIKKKLIKITMWSSDLNGRE